MKKTALLIWGLFTLICVNAQSFIEKTITTDIKEVTVFINGSQITRTKSIDLQKGNYELKFTELSPFIEPKSIQLKTNGEITLLSINYQKDYLKNKEKNKQIEELQAKIKQVEDNIQIEEVTLQSLNDELSFLTANMKIAGTAQTVTALQLREAYAFFNEKINTIRLKILEKQNVIKKQSNEIEKYRNQQNALTNGSIKEYPQGEIIVKIENKQTDKINFELLYTTSEASWLPTYDVIAKSIDQPLRLVYKANVRQNTQEDWTNVRLRLSSANPNHSNIAQQIRTYYIDDQMRPPTYTSTLIGNSNQVTGRVYDAQTNEPISFTTIVLKGTTIGTMADEDGFYTITLPDQNLSNTLEASFIGYESSALFINKRNKMDIFLKPESNKLEEVIVTGYGTQKAPKLDGQSIRNSLQGKTPNVVIRGTSSVKSNNDITPVVTEITQNTTSIDFDIKTPYTIPSDGKPITVAIAEYNLPAEFVYYCAPKIERDVYLTANITNWEALNLLEGEASLFFENTFTGKTIIDTRTASDTLTLSLGRDKGITVTRELQKNYSTKRFLGSKKEETRAWHIIVRNNKPSNITLHLADQIPVSRTNDSEVKLQNITPNYILNPKSGELKWILNLNPKESKDIDLQYQIRYPKEWNIVIE